MISLEVGRKDGNAQPKQKPRKQKVEEQPPEDHAVNGKQGWADQRSLRQISLSHGDGRAATFKDRLNFSVGEFAAEFGLFFFDLRTPFFGKLRDDVVLLLAGQPEFHGVQVTIDEFHNYSFLSSASENVFERRVNALPLGQQLLQNRFAIGGQAIETLVALILFAPLADQQALRLEAAKQGIERAFVNRHAVFSQRFAQRIAVVLDSKRRQHRKGQAAAPKLLSKIFKPLVDFNALRHTVYDTYYVSYSIKCQEKMPNLRAICVSLGGEGIRSDQATVEVEVVIDHAFGGKALAGAGVSAVAVSVAQAAIGVKAAKNLGEAVGVVRAEIKRGVSPDFAKAGNVVGDESAAGECGVKGGQAQRFISCGSGVDRGTTVKSAQLSFGLCAANGDAAPIGRDFHIGANGNLRNRDSLFRAYNANWKRLNLLRQQKNLFAGVQQAADREHRIFFTDVGIEKDWIASGINHRFAARACIGGAKCFEHPRGWANHCVRGANAGDDRIAVPPHPAARTRRAILDGFRPRDDVAMSHHHPRDIDGEIGVAKLMEVKHVGLQLAHQVCEKLRGLR